MDFWHDAAAQKRWLRRFALLTGVLLLPVLVLAVFAPLGLVPLVRLAEKTPAPVRTALPWAVLAACAAACYALTPNRALRGRARADLPQYRFAAQINGGSLLNYGTLDGVYAHLDELKEKLRTSLLLITHDLGVVAQVCDRVAIMYAGEIVESGTIAEVFDHPHHPYTIGLFGSIPSLDETAEKLKPIQGQMPDPTELPEGCAFAPRCPYATGACRTRKPEMTGVGGTQMVRCLAHQGVFEFPELMEEVRHGR